MLPPAAKRKIETQVRHFCPTLHCCFSVTMIFWSEQFLNTFQLLNCFVKKNVSSLKCWFYFTKSNIYMYTCICIYIFFFLKTFQSISHLKSLPLNPGSLFKKQPEQPKLPSLCLNICFRIQNNCLVEFELLIQTLLKYIHFKNTDDTATFSLWWSHR